MAIKDIPRLNFAHLPTPVEELPRLREALHGGPRLLVKRDDQTGVAFGGNKTRKLEFLVAEAREQGANTLITGGALQSNHCRQTAAAATRLGFRCILVLTGDKAQKASGNLLIYYLERRSYTSPIGKTATEFCKRRLIERSKKERNLTWFPMADRTQPVRWDMHSQ